MEWLKLLSADRLGKKFSDKRGLSRSAFEQDFDRVVFSPPFRQLQDKTQVFPLPKEAFVHSRLTHSLEVSSVGRSLGRKVGGEIIGRHQQLKSNGFSAFDFGAVTAAAALAHDLGNPPFGHSGEEAISDFFKNHKAGTFFKTKVKARQISDLEHFEGNAQGFRIMTTTYSDALGLTLATLAAFTKYPVESGITPNPARKSQKKYGFFQSEKGLFEEVASHIGLKKLDEKNYAWCRHPLAFLVEAADDICYSLIDLEDGCNLGLIGFDQVLELYHGILREKLNRQKLQERAGVAERTGLLRAIGIGILIEECAAAFWIMKRKSWQGGLMSPLPEIFLLGQPWRKYNKYQ